MLELFLAGLPGIIGDISADLVWVYSLLASARRGGIKPRYLHGSVGWRCTDGLLRARKAAGMSGLSWAFLQPGEVCMVLLRVISQTSINHNCTEKIKYFVLDIGMLYCT